MTFKPGQIINIPCTVSTGAFTGEVFITIESDRESISGFVPREYLSRIDGEYGLIPATIQDVSKNELTVTIRGSFFTTTGLAYLSQEWAQSNVKPVQEAQHFQ